MCKIVGVRHLYRHSLLIAVIGKLDMIRQGKHDIGIELTCDLRLRHIDELGRDRKDHIRDLIEQTVVFRIDAIKRLTDLAEIIERIRCFRKPDAISQSNQLIPIVIDTDHRIVV